MIRVLHVLCDLSAGGAERLATDYTGHCLKQVGYAYHELVDYLMFKYLVGSAEVAPPTLPAIGPPAVPAFRPSK